MSRCDSKLAEIFRAFEFRNTHTSCCVSTPDSSPTAVDDDLINLRQRSAFPNFKMEGARPIQWIHVCLLSSTESIESRETETTENPIIDFNGVKKDKRTRDASYTRRARPSSQKSVIRDRAGRTWCTPTVRPAVENPTRSSYAQRPGACTVVCLEAKKQRKSPPRYPLKLCPREYASSRPKIALCNHKPDSRVRRPKSYRFSPPSGEP